MSYWEIPEECNDYNYETIRIKNPEGMTQLHAIPSGLENMKFLIYNRFTPFRVIRFSS
jgi:hypothetical protein